LYIQLKFKSERVFCKKFETILTRFFQYIQKFCNWPAVFWISQNYKAQSWASFTGPYYIGRQLHRVENHWIRWVNFKNSVNVQGESAQIASIKCVNLVDDFFSSPCTQRRPFPVFLRDASLSTICRHSTPMTSSGVNFTNILRAAFQKLLVKCWWNWHQVSISPTFYEQLFCAKVFCKAFLLLQFGFVIFCKIILSQKLLLKCCWNWFQ